MNDMMRGMNLLVELNHQMIGSIQQLRASQIHCWDNPIMIDDEPSEDNLVDTAPIPEEHQLVPINELVASESSGDDEDKIWEISHEEFVGSSPRL